MVERVRARGYEGLTSHRRIRTDEVEPQAGWFFAFALALDGVVSSREVYPIFVGPDGTEDPELAQWLLDRAGTGKREQWDEDDPPAVDDAFETAVSTARSRALGRLLHRQAELTDANRLRLDQERQKLERYYEFAYGQLTKSWRQCETCLSGSALPTLPKSSASSGLAQEPRERQGRRRRPEPLSGSGGSNELNGREQVTAQHELLGISFISIVPQTVLPL